MYVKAFTTQTCEVLRLQLEEATSNSYNIGREGLLVSDKMVCFS